LAVYSPLSLPLSRSALFFLDSACSIRQHTSAYVLHPAWIMSTLALVHAFTYSSPAAYVSIRQHTSAYVSIRLMLFMHLRTPRRRARVLVLAYRLRRMALATGYSSYMCPHTTILLYVCSHTTICVLTLAYSLRRMALSTGYSSYVSIRQHTSAYGLLQLCVRILLYMCPHICIQITMRGITTSGQYEDTS
jgi:hypothetical protein